MYKISVTKAVRILVQSYLIGTGLFAAAYGETATLAIEKAIIFRTQGSAEVTGTDGEKRSVVRPIKLPPKSDPALSASGGSDPTAYTAGEAPDPATVFPGETVTTGEDSLCDLVIPDVGTFRLGANSELKISVRETEEEAHPASSIEHLKGRTFYNITPAKEAEEAPAGDRPVFRVKTPHAILGIRGTRFFVETTAGFDVTGVHRGAVAVTETVAGKTVELEKGTVCYAKPEEITDARAMTKEQLALAEIYDGFELQAVRLKFLVADAYHSVPAPGGDKMVPVDGESKTTLVVLDSGFRWTIPRELYSEGLSTRLFAELPTPGHGREFAQFVTLKARGTAIKEFSSDIGLGHDGLHQIYNATTRAKISGLDLLAMAQPHTDWLVPSYINHWGWGKAPPEGWGKAPPGYWPEGLSAKRFAWVTIKLWRNSFDLKLMERSPKLENYEMEAQVQVFSYRSAAAPE